MNIERFLSDRSPVWDALDALLTRADDVDLSRVEMQELVELYRRTCSDLNRARSQTANPEILGHLNQLTGRAYRFIYRAGHETQAGPAFVRLIRREIPSAFRRERLSIAIAAAAFLLGTLFGSIAVLVDPPMASGSCRPCLHREPEGARGEDRARRGAGLERGRRAALRRVALHAQHPRLVLAFALGAMTIVLGIVIRSTTA